MFSQLSPIKVMKYEAQIMMSFIYLETLNIEWGQIDLKGNRRVKRLIRMDQEGRNPASTRPM